MQALYTKMVASDDNKYLILEKYIFFAESLRFIFLYWAWHLNHDNIITECQFDRFGRNNYEVDLYQSDHRSHKKKEGTV